MVIVTKAVGHRAWPTTLLVRVLENDFRDAVRLSMSANLLETVGREAMRDDRSTSTSPCSSSRTMVTRRWGGQLPMTSMSPSMTRRGEPSSPAMPSRTTRPPDVRQVASRPPRLRRRLDTRSSAPPVAMVADRVPRSRGRWRPPRGPREVEPSGRTPVGEDGRRVKARRVRPASRGADPDDADRLTRIRARSRPEHARPGSTSTPAANEIVGSRCTTCRGTPRLAVPARAGEPDLV